MSMCNVTGSHLDQPTFISILWRYIDSFAASDAAMYSASVLLRPTEFCFLDSQLIKELLKKKTNPVYDFRSILSPAQSASTNPFSNVESPFWYTSCFSQVPARYLKMCYNVPFIQQNVIYLAWLLWQDTSTCQSWIDNEFCRLSDIYHRTWVYDQDLNKSNTDLQFSIQKRLRASLTYCFCPNLMSPVSPSRFTSMSR